MSYLPISQRGTESSKLRMISGTMPGALSVTDATETLTLPKVTLTPRGTISITKPSPKPMVFEALPGAVEQVVSGKQPLGISAKLPFIQKEIQFPQDLIGGIQKWVTEWPEKIAVSLAELPYVIKNKTVPEYTGKAYRVPSYAEEAGNMIKSLIDLGYSNKEALTVAILQTGGQAIIDVVIISDLIRIGTSKVLSGIAPNIEERVAAWKLLGKPTTPEEMSANVRKIAPQFHPDKIGPTNSTEAMTTINNAYNILKETGLPGNLDLIKIKAGSLAKALAEPGTPIFSITKGKIKVTPIEDILKPSVALGKIGKSVELPRLPVAALPGYVPMEARPTFGLRGMEIEKVKPVGKATPIAQKATKLGVPAEKGIILQNEIKLYKGIGAEIPNINRFAFGSHFADNPKLAREYGKTIVNETIPKGEKIANLDILKQEYAKKGILADPEKITQELINKGYKWARGTLPDGQFEYVKLTPKKELVRVEATYPGIGPKYSTLIEKESLKGVKEVKPAITKQAMIPKAEAELSRMYETEFKKIKSAGEKQLFDDIKSAGGIKVDPTLKEEMSDLPIDIMRTTGMMPDEMIETLRLKGYKFESSSELLEAIKDVRGMPTRFRPAKTDLERQLNAVRSIRTKMPMPKDLTKGQLERMERRLIREATKKGITIPPRRIIERVTGIRPERRMITKPEDVLLKARVKAEARGARIGFGVARSLTREELITKFKSSRTTIRELKEEVMDRIKNNLPLEARGKFLQAFERDLTRKNVYGLYERIERMSEQLKRREIIEELRDVPKGNIAVDYQKRLEETMVDIDLVKPTERTLQKLQGLSKYIKEEGTPLDINPATLDKLDRLSKKNVSQMTIAELTELQDTVKTLQQLGKLKFQLKFKYNQRERQLALRKLLDSTNNMDPPVTPIMGRLGQWDMAKVQTRRLYIETVHTPRVADMIDGYKGYQGENAKYIKRLGAKETLAKVETQSIVSSALDEIQALGVKELTPDQQLRMMINIRIQEGAYDQAKTLMERAKLTKVPELTDTENKIIEIVKKATNKSTDEIAAISEEIENKPFRRTPGYILPIKYEYEFNIIPSQTIEQGRHRVAQTFKGFLYERQKGVERVPRIDVLGIFEGAINEQQWYIKIQPELENLKYLVRSKEYLDKGGQMVANFWKDYMDVVARRGWSAMAGSNPLLRAARINLGRAILGYKLTSILMQPFAIFDAIAYANTRFGGTASLQILKEFSKAWINPRYARQIIAESPALQMRMAGEVAVEELAPGLVSKPPKGIERKIPPIARTILRKFQREALTLLQDFDIRTAAGVQKAVEKILVKNGVPNAKQEAEFFMNVTQGSAEITYRPLILSKGEGSRTVFTFQTFFLNRWGIIAHDLITSGLLKGRTWKKKFAALIGLGIMMAASVSENEARYAILGLTKKTKRKASMWVAALMTLPENVPIFGNMVSSFVTYGSGTFDFPLARVVENAIAGLGVATKKTEEAKIKAALRGTEAFTTLLGVAGSAQFFDFLEGLFGGEEKGSTVMPMPTKREAGRPSLIMPEKLAP